MFKDRVRLKLKAGHGGSGKVAFGPNHMAMGGNGGKGGDVYLEGSNSLYDLTTLKPEFVYAAENGEPGGIKNLSGRNGEDLIIKVPIATNVVNDEKEVVLRIEKHGERKLLLEGGIGGQGNWFFRRGGVRTAEKFTEGKPGAELSATFVLELQSDIIFIGLPNAGKSSILNSLTNADARVAAYPFTTLSPQLGRMGEIVLMDLPGLIEKTAEGKGLGTSFVKHTKSAKLVAHFVSLESDDPKRDYELMRKELEAISPDLAGKPEVIILTKTDVIASADIPKRIKEFEKSGKPVSAVSVYDLDGIEKLKEFMQQNLSEIQK
jgi:GTP-binding protein